LNIVRFEMNVPTAVSLMSPQGTRVEGRYGDQVMYTLSDGRVMYVPPKVAEKIEAQGITVGEPFELCKARVSAGRRQTIEWRLRRRDPEEPQPPTFSDSPSPETVAAPIDAGDPEETRLEFDLRRSIQLVSAKNAANGSAPPPPPPNGNGASANGQTTTPVTKLEHALKTAISAAFNAEKYGAELGYVVRFDADAIKSMAITVLINMSEGGRR